MITLPELTIEGRAWVRIEVDGVLWEVAPDYVFPVGISEALLHAEAAGCELPTPAMVDATWAAADLQLPPWPMANDGTMATMASQAVYAAHARRIEQQIAGREYSLLAGSHKDVVRLADGALALYGWHVTGELAAGGTYHGIPLHRPATPGLAAMVIQPVYTRHQLGHRDYSQGARLYRRVAQPRSLG